MTHQIQNTQQQILQEKQRHTNDLPVQDAVKILTGESGEDEEEVTNHKNRFKLWTTYSQRNYMKGRICEHKNKSQQQKRRNRT